MAGAPVTSDTRTTDSTEGSGASHRNRPGAAGSTVGDAPVAHTSGPSAGHDDEAPATRQVNWGWGRWAWRTLTSMRTAVILLGLLALAAVPGSLLPQRNVASDPMAVTRFMDRYPGWSTWLDRLGFFEVFASPWFAAIYVLLLVSMVGCVVPRCLTLWTSVRAAPPPAPRHMQRYPGYRVCPVDADYSTAALDRAAAELRRRRFRVEQTPTEVRAEKGYVRELGNLLFHLSLLVLLLGIALGRLFGFEGRVVVVEGAGFSNTVSQYDVFSPRPLTDVLGLEPFSFTLDDVQVAYETAAPRIGEPREFTSEVTYRTPGGEQDTARIEPNHPLEVDGTKVFMTGNGYAPVVTVSDSRGETIFEGPVVFLPIDTSYASDGVVKAPGARTRDLAFEGFFLPTAAVDASGPYSAFPDLLDPRLVLTAYEGDLGLSSGVPQSVYALDKTGLTQVLRQGKPVAQALRLGETLELPDGRGSLTFTDVRRFANFQIARDPGKEVSLAAAIMLLVGLTVSLTVRRRRIWIRVAPDTDGAVEIASLAMTRRESPPDELDALARALTHGTSDATSTRSSTPPTSMEKP